MAVVMALEVQVWAAAVVAMKGVGAREKALSVGVAVGVAAVETWVAAGQW